jgi:regulator of sigma E protease
VSVLGVIVAIVGLGFLILAHEFGHFIVAKATGMRVEEFSIGFGRYLISKRIGETVYGISWLPLGGYVRVTGMHKEEFQARIEEAREKEAERRAELETKELIAERNPEKKRRRPSDPEDRLAGPRALTADEIASTPLERRYYSHPFWHKVLFIIAGVTMNVLVAFLLFFAYGLYEGDSYPTTTVRAVVAEGPAAAAGMQPGDKVLTVDGTAVSDWEAVRTYIHDHAGQTITLVVDRAGQMVTLTPLLKEQSDGAGGTVGYLGVEAKLQRAGLGFGESLKFAGTRTGSGFKLIFTGFKMMFTGQAPVTGSQGLAGPVGIIQISSEAYASGTYLLLLAFISINLAIVNMLPLLPLDGGHVLFNVIEKIRGKSISLRVFEQVSMVGLVIFVALFILATTNDIGRLFG